jgi:hypothetical protein
LSVRAEILRVILKKIVLGLEGKNSFKNAQKVDFTLLHPKNGQKYHIGPLKTAIT